MLIEVNCSLKRFFLEPHILKHYKCITECFYSFNSYANTCGLFNIRGHSQLMSTVRVTSMHDNVKIVLRVL